MNLEDDFIIPDDNGFDEPAEALEMDDFNADLKGLHQPQEQDDNMFEEYEPVDPKGFLHEKYDSLMQNHLQKVEQATQDEYGMNLNEYLDYYIEKAADEGYSEEEAKNMFSEHIKSQVQLDQQTLDDYQILDLAKAFEETNGRVFGNGLDDKIPDSVFQNAAKEGTSLREAFNDYTNQQNEKQAAEDKLFLDGFNSI